MSATMQKFPTRLLDEMSQKKGEVDLDEKTILVPFEAPLSIVLQPETGVLTIENENPHQNAHGISVRAVFSRKALLELLLSLKRIETALNTGIEEFVETNILDES
ncbi:MAG: hypothetical protein LBK01_00140 [Burkholderiaceae bacterium]|jgi:hypothetical protein|nr:hypothetical protein [Burkholderiaceae bacterium]